MLETVILISFGEAREECLGGNMEEMSGILNILFLELFI